MLAKSAKEIVIYKHKLEMEMQDLKIKVNTVEESKEAQELFFELGYKDRKNWTQRNPEHESIQAWQDGEFTFSLNHNQVPVRFKETTLAELRAMVEPKMKEYLMPNRDYEYILTDAREGLEPHAKDWIEIPAWANYAYKNDLGVCFTRQDIGRNHPLLIWQRPTQPETLPFIDDEPQSLNDQYAEIEQVRQAGLKFDNGKPRHSLLPKGSISSIIAVLEFGAKKYKASDWQKVDNAKERYYDAAMRHIDSWWNGEKFDQETGIHHLAHAATNLFFLKWFDDKEINNEK